MFWCFPESDREKVGFVHGSLRSQFRVESTLLRDWVVVVWFDFLNTSYLVAMYLYLF